MTGLRVGMQIGAFTIEKMLPEGRGGFAQVVLARREGEDGPLGEVAIKLALVDTTARDPDKAADQAETRTRAIENEVEILRQLHHPGIVRIFPVQLDARRSAYSLLAAELEGRPRYFVMERVTGGSLTDLLDRHKRLAVPLAAEIAQQVCAALEYVHARGFAHLDIKGSNILFQRPVDDLAQPQAVLIDFGSAQRFTRRLAEDDDNGTLPYSPPERVAILHGQAPPESFVDKKAADIYSLGVVLYRMLTGRLPFTGTPSHVATAILTRSPTSPRDHNPDLRSVPRLEELVLAMLQKEPGLRPAADRVIAWLEEAVPSPRFGPPGGAVARQGEATHGRATGWRLFAVSCLAVAVVEGGLLVRDRVSWPIQPAVVGTATMTPHRGITSPVTPPPVSTAGPAPTRAKAPATKAPSETPEAETLQATVTPMPTSTPAPPTPTPMPTALPTLPPPEPAATSGAPAQ